MNAEADDLGGEAEFVLGFGVVGGEHAGRGVAGGGDVAAGGTEEEHGEAEEEGLQDDGGNGLGVGHMGAYDVRCLFVDGTIG